MKWQNRHQRLSGIFAIIGGFCGEMCVGLTYLWGAISIYVVSYFRQYEPDVTTRDFLLYLPIWGFYEILLYPVAAYVKDRFSARAAIVIGVLIMTSCLIGCAYVRSSLLFIFIYATAMGFIDGFGYVVNLANAIQHFPAHKSLVGGSVLSALGLSTFIFSFVALAIVNPQNKSPDIVVTTGQAEDKYYSSEIYDNVPKMFIIFGITFFIIGMMAVVLSTNPPPHPNINIVVVHEQEAEEKRTPSVIPIEGLSVEGPNIASRKGSWDDEIKTQRDYDVYRLLAYQEANESIMDASMVQSANSPQIPHNQNVKEEVVVNKDAENECSSVGQGLKTTVFWIFIIMSALPRTLAYFFSMCYKELGNTYDYSDVFLTVVGGTYSILYGIGRLLWGWLFPKWGFNTLNCIIVIGCVIASVLLLSLGMYPAIFLITVLSCGLLGCGNSVIYPPKSCEIFGPKFGSKMYSFICGGFALAGILLFVGNLFLVPLLGIKYFLSLAAGLLLFNILFGFKCLIKPKWK